MSASPLFLTLVSRSFRGCSLRGVPAGEWLALSVEKQTRRKQTRRERSSPSSLRLRSSRSTRLFTPQVCPKWTTTSSSRNSLPVGAQMSALSTSCAPPLALLSTALGASAYLYHSRPLPSSAPKPSHTADLEADPTVFYPRLRLQKLALVGALLLLEAETLFRWTWDAERGESGRVGLENGLMAGFWVSGRGWVGWECAVVEGEGGQGGGLLLPAWELQERGVG